MTIDLFLLIAWIICGVLTFISVAISGDPRISVWSYACCWAFLIMQLVSKL